MPFKRGGTLQRIDRHIPLCFENVINVRPAGVLQFREIGFVISCCPICHSSWHADTRIAALARAPSGMPYYRRKPSNDAPQWAILSVIAQTPPHPRAQCQAALMMEA